MRKAEYLMLANIFRNQIARTHGDAAQAQYANDDAAKGARYALQGAARLFAGQASVDRIEFLKACGIDP